MDERGRSITMTTPSQQVQHKHPHTSSELQWRFRVAERHVEEARSLFRPIALPRLAWLASALAPAAPVPAECLSASFPAFFLGLW